MLSKILVKLIDKAIVPTVLLLSARVVSIVLAAKYMDINIKISSEGLITQNSADYVKLNSYSILFMLAMLVIGLIYVAAKGLIFHDSHIKPTITARLFSIKAKSLIQSSSEIYPQWGIWSLYSFMLSAVSGIMAMSGLAYFWVFYLVTFVTLINAVLFIYDFEDDIKIKMEAKK
jgi:hypothetical protein